MAELPTVEEILKVKSIIPEFEKAWKDSFTSKTHCCEQGGFIYADPAQPKTKLYVVRAQKGSSDNQQKPVGVNMSIDLNNPGTKQDYILVANFHTHPLHPSVGGNSYPSKADKENAYFRQVPGIVISREGVVKYGVSNRTDRRNPKGYPPEPPGPAQPVTDKVVQKPPPPTRAPNQWEPGASVQWFSIEEEQNEEERAPESKNGGNEDNE